MCAAAVRILHEKGMTMETMQPTLKNGRNVWDPINMPAAEFQERVKKLTKGMKREAIDVLLLYGNTFNEYGNPCYLSNYIMRLQRGALVVVTRKGDVALIFEGASRGLPTAKKMTWVKEVIACGDVPKECAKFLKEKKLVPSTVGFAGLRNLMPNDQLQFLSDSLSGCKIIDADPLVRDMRMVKSQREGDQIRRSSRILARAFTFLSGTSFSDLNERVLEAMVCRETRLEGAEDFRMMIAKPNEGNWAFRPAEEVLLSSGKTVIVYLAVEFERYWAEGVRTYTVKDSSLVPVQSEDVGSLYERLMNGIKPGKASAQFYREAMREIKKSKREFIPEYGLGEGIGLGLKEFPVFAAKKGAPLRDGICFSLRLLVRDKSLGAVMIGNTLLLTKKGPEVLTR